MRLIWHFTTPRKLRRNALIALLIWTAVAFAHHEGVFDKARDAVSDAVPESVPWKPLRTQNFTGLPAGVDAPRTL